MASPATPISVNGGADSTLRATTGTVYGFAVWETSGTTAAVFKLRATTSSGQIVIPVSLAAGESAREYFTHGIVFDRGVFEDWISGAYEGTVFIGDG